MNLISNTEIDAFEYCGQVRENDSKPAIGFIRNFGLKRGAIASCVGHDSHNIIAVGVTHEDICNAVNGIIDHKGGNPLFILIIRIDFAAACCGE